MKRQLLIMIAAISPLVLLATACETRSEAETAPSTEAPARRLLP